MSKTTRHCSACGAPIHSPTVLYYHRCAPRPRHTQPRKRKARRAGALSQLTWEELLNTAYQERGAQPTTRE